MINFKQIEAFRAVMLSGSMTKAAKQLHTSQPNVSRIIGQLERRIGIRLFERVSGRLIPTQEGSGFFNDVEYAFSALRSLEDSAASIRNYLTGRLRIVAVPSLAAILVPTAIADFTQRYPNVSVSLHVSDSLTVCQSVANGNFDIGIASETYDSVGSDSVVLCQSEGVCILPQNHRLALRDTPLTPDDLNGERFLSMARGDSMRRRIDLLFNQGGEDRRKLIYETHYATARNNMVGLGMGVSLVDPLTLQDVGGGDSAIKVLPFAPTIYFHTFLVFSQNHPNTILAKQFSGYLTSCIEKKLEKHKGQVRHLV
ncbi:LysR family transcriptional regulator [Brenneria goodwinii]|uniref:LysR substrate-binding domain-containing protein n=1 Tax=Brenneria goodwinii TaxID=1109412 RepID=UPI000BAF5507|nr:LysR substrate-binding domain-containing protein [Brenneria goodwinii]MCG8158805.1 LysR family transcriptional regulator [Brenneria goodwinii]MCG8163392.1 LysR family transcriptional regulator [Brenneria goodwinii]MCG8167934.1 LysR family transcriptional regulator [Brenneria goodwinii]MCG8172543.1 LysR family transcriptional regulator [Brenneria goodwinii]MCG8177263.1 LysR family transcriptional regulator [Brenneria goodwinii]